mgnify:FL=1
MLFKTGPWSRIAIVDYAGRSSRIIIHGTPGIMGSQLRVVNTGKSIIMSDHSGRVHNGLKGSSLTEKYISTRINIRAMSPLLLDSRDLFRIGLFTITIASVIFAGGFVFGFQKAETVLVTGSSTRVLELPEKLETTLSEIEPRIPEVRAVGEHIDVDRPDSVAQQTPGETVETTEIVMQSAATVAVKPGSPGKHAIAEIAVADKSSGTDMPEQQSLAAGNSTTGDSASEQAVIDTGSQAPPLPVLPSDSELSRAKYSIQVGMYGSLQNAQNMVELLRAKGMQAYVSEYLNSKNELRYNVRFGFFANKGNALAMLEQFKSRQQGDGYLVRFSAESLARLTAAGERDESTVEQPASKTEQVDSTS